jgi:hypothetical protein
VSFDSIGKKQSASAHSSKRSGSGAKQSASAQSSKRSFPRGKRLLSVTIEEYILDHRSQNHSPKTIEWHTIALGNFATFLEKQGVTFIEQIERVHVLAWLTNLGTEPGPKGKKLS